MFLLRTQNDIAASAIAQDIALGRRRWNVLAYLAGRVEEVVEFNRKVKVKLLRRRTRPQSRCFFGHDGVGAFTRFGTVIALGQVRCEVSCLLLARLLGRVVGSGMII